MHKAITPLDGATITVVVAEDHQLVRQGIMLMLRKEEDFAVIGEAGDGLEAIEVVKAKRPQILLLDLMIPRLHGLEVTRQVRRNYPETKVVILSMHKEECYVAEALRNGASGYVLKDSTGTDLVEAIRKVKLGRRYLSPSLAEIAITLLEQKPLDPAHDVYDSLSTRERLVLELAAQGMSSPDMADRLFISRRTVETHRANLMRKLDLHSQTDLVRFAIRKGLIPA
jgi:two-component system, NarL family, response regulator NreC